jgi:hypothetical protein
MKIAAYMDLLTSSRSARDEFRADAQAAMIKFGLSEQERAVIATRDAAKIRAEVAKVDPNRAKALHITF